MSETLRSFIAIEIPRELHEAIGPLSLAFRKLKAGGKARLSVPPLENLHMTLHFLGDIDVADLNGIIDAVDAALGELPAFSCELHGAGAFPNLHRPAVAWVGVRQNEPLRELHRRVMLALDVEKKSGKPAAFRPHLTLARVRHAPRGAVADLLKPYFTKHFGTFEVSRLTLFQSTLDPGGAIYTPLHHWPLKKQDGRP